MTKQIYGGFDVTNNATALGNRTVQSINGTVFDENGEMVLDGYTTEEMNDIISVLPLSRYGTHTYLPAGVSGDFLGASENRSYRYIKPYLEDDGTLVMLRSGTNGSTIGLYYSYLSNAMNVNNLNTSINTNRVYRPGYLPSNLTAVSTVSSDKNLVVGRMITTGTSTVSSNIYTSFTNGTLDDTMHSGFIIPLSTVCPLGGDLRFVFLGHDGYIYYLSHVTSGSFLNAINIVRVNYNSISGTYTSEELIGWSGSVYANAFTASRAIKISEIGVSTTASEKPYVLLQGANITGSILYAIGIDVYAEQNPSNLNQIRIRFGGDSWASTPSYQIRPQTANSMVINISTKAVTLDTGYQVTPAPLVITDTGTELSASGNIVDNTSMYYHIGQGNLANSWEYIPEANKVVCISTPNEGRPPIVQLGDYPLGVNLYDAINYRSHLIPATKTGLMYSAYGSVIGSSILGIELLPNNTTKQSTLNGNGDATLTYAQHGSATTYPFTSFTLGSITGYEPTVNRVQISNNNDNKMFISTVSGSTVTTNGGILIEGKRESQPLNYTFPITGSTQTISINSTAFTNFKNSEFGKVTGITFDNGQKSAVLYCPQQTDIPAMVLLTAVTTSYQYFYRFVEVNVNTRSGNITTITFKRLISQGTVTTQIRPSVNANIDISSSGITIYDAGSFYFIGGSDQLLRTTIGFNTGYNWTAVVEKSTSQYSRLTLQGSWSAVSIGTQPFALPGIGFGYNTVTDSTTRVIFNKVGTTLAEYDAWTSSSRYNLVSQEVASGFILYFTEETPVMLSGKSFTMPITNIDLSTIKSNPANTTFHLYIRMEQGLAKYYVTENVIAETGTDAYNIFWIGTVVTNANQIDTINVKKRSRLDVFGESLESAGSSFPVSYGSPSSTGTINW